MDPSSLNGRPTPANPTSASSSAKKKRPSHSAASFDRSPPPDGTPDLGKVRAYAACKTCRLKKIKCLPGPSRGVGTDSSSAPGPCQQCTQAGVECTYPPTRDRAAYSRQYVQNLEGRVHALETVNARLMPLLEAFESGQALPAFRQDGVPRGRLRQERGMYPPGTIAPDQLGGEPRDAYTVKGEMTSGDEERDESEDEFAEDAGQLTQDEHGNYRWVGTSNTLSLLDSFDHATSPRSRQPLLAGVETQHTATNPFFAPVAGSGVVKALPTVDEVMYPSPSAAEEMIEAYFSEIHPILPIVIEQEFREGYKALMDRRARGIPEVSGIFISVVFAVYALGERVLVSSRAWQRERQKLGKENASEGVKSEDTVLPGEAEAGVVWYERAQILRYTTITDISMHQVQALILMATFQAAVNAMPIAWLLCGIALRMAQDLGLHRSNARLKLSLSEKQLRARVWWAAYGLDRMLSLTLGRPPGVDDLDIDVPYPAEIDDTGIQAFTSPRSGADSSTAAPSPIPVEPPTSVMSGFIALTKLCKLAGKISHILYRPSHGRSAHDPNWLNAQQTAINKLDKALRDWLDTEVPAKYKDQNSDPAIQLVSAVLSNTYFACLITLHRNFLPPSPDSSRPRPPPSSTSLSHCVAAARSVIHIAAQSKILLPPTHHLAVFCQYLWSAAVMLLLCEVQAKDQVVVDAVKPQVDSCRRSLQALEPVWPGARKLKELLGEAERRGRQVLVAGGPKPVTKKRKSSSQDRQLGLNKRPSLPASHSERRSATTTNSPSKLSGTGQWSEPMPHRPSSASRPSSHAYETSDTRSNSVPAFTAPLPSISTIAPFALDQNQYQLPSVTDPLSAQGYTFDVGGVDFDGLEMLQGFNNDFASIWSSLLTEPMSNLPSPNQPMSTTAAANPSSIITTEFGGLNGNGVPGSQSSAGGPSGIGFDRVSGMPNSGAQALPIATPISSGPSPSQWLQTSPQVASSGPGVTAGFAYGALPDLASSEFWSQVAAVGQDWGADPNVPFSFDGLK